MLLQLFLPWGASILVPTACSWRSLLQAAWVGFDDSFELISRKRSLSHLAVVDFSPCVGAIAHIFVKQQSVASCYSCHLTGSRVTNSFVLLQTTRKCFEFIISSTRIACTLNSSCRYQRDTDRHRGLRETQGETGRHRQTHRDKDRDNDRDRQTDKQTDRHREMQLAVALLVFLK